ncbi:MAG: EAL domain-containing protein [Myxococcota bacterium]
MTKRLQVLVLERSSRDDALSVELSATPGIHVIRVVTILDALRRLETQSDLDAIVTFVDLDQTERVEKLQRGYPHVPVVAVAATEDDELSTRVMGLGAQDIVRIDELELRLTRVTRRAVERVRATRSMGEREERYDLAVRGANDGLWDWHLDDDRIHFSERWKSMLGFAPHELDASSDAWFGRVHADDLDAVKRELGEHIEGRRDGFEAEYRILHRDGTYRWMLARGLAVRNERGHAYRIAGSQTDITKRKAAEGLLEHQALHDELTGLPNRALLLDRLSRAMVRQQEHGIPFAVVSLFLDNHAAITDSFGHEQSEAWTQTVAEALRALRGPTDTLARVGRDHFFLLVDNPDDLAKVVRLANAIQHELEAPRLVGSEELFSTVSVGVVLGDGERRHPEDYLRDASVAMNRAKALGGGQHRVFDAPMHRRIVERLQVEKDLRLAIAAKQFRIRYQPVVSLRTGKVAGFEALLRWEHPRRGLLLPGGFIEVAERAGLLSGIFEVIFPQILAQVCAWQRARPEGPPLFINVNLSRGQVRDPSLVERIDEMMAEHPVGPFTLGFELTESMMVDDASVLATLRALKARDIRLLLDDFGTGYSSLANLKNYPIDSLKVDRSFLRELGMSGDNTEIVRAIVSLAHSMRMDVTVEGIESENQLLFVSGLGCEYGQGFFFAPALDVEAAGHALAQGYRLSAPPPSSGTVPRSAAQGRGSVALVGASTATQRTMKLQLEGRGYDVITLAADPEPEGAPGSETRASVPPPSSMSPGASSPPEVMVIDATEPEAVLRCRRLRTSPHTAAIPIVMFTEGDATDQLVTDALEAGAADFMVGATPLPIVCARLDAQIHVGRANKRLATIAMVDELTGVFSRRFLVQALRRAVKASSRGQPSGLACLVVDPDRLAHVNDELGPVEGDRVLRQVARTLDQTTRETDLVARYGGEEFAVILADATREGARKVAEKVRVAIEQRCSTTVSVGGVFLAQAAVDALRADPDRLIAELLDRAHAAMKRAKDAGRNRVIFASSAEAAGTA